MSKNLYTDEEAQRYRGDVIKITAHYNRLLSAAASAFGMITLLCALRFAFSYRDIFYAAALLLASFIAAYKKTPAVNILMGVVWIVLPIFNFAGLLSIAKWIAFDIPMGILYFIGIKKAARYNELSEIDGFPYFSYRREAPESAYAVERTDNKRSSNRIYDDVNPALKDVVSETAAAMKERVENRGEKPFGIKRKFDFITETRGNLLKQTAFINRYFKILAVVHIILLLISIFRLLIGGFMAIGQPDVSQFNYPTDGEIISAFLFAILAVAAVYKHPIVSAVTAALWIALPRYGSWEYIFENGNFVLTYIIFNVVMALVYGFGVYLSARWQKLKAMPNFPTFAGYPEDDEEGEWTYIAVPEEPVVKPLEEKPCEIEEDLILPEEKAYEIETNEDNNDNAFYGMDEIAPTVFTEENKKDEASDFFGMEEI